MIDRNPNPAAAPDLSEEAAFWCMRLHAQDCTPEERAAFDRWLKQDTAHAAEYQEMLDIWTVSAELPRHDHYVGAPNINAKTLGVRARRFAAAAVVVVVAGLVGWNQGWLPNRYQRFSTEDDLRVVILADGSRVQLNRKTSLAFLNFRDRRYVLFSEGEAFFQVQHDATHPFQIRSGSGRITVTGTQFNVWKYNEQTTVTLVEGNVTITNDLQQPIPTSIHLLPGQQASYDHSDAKPQVTPVDANNILAWREGKLIISNLPLAEALPLINRYLTQPVALADAAIGSLRIGGIFNTNDIEGLVKSLPKVLPVQLAHDDNGNTIIESKKSSGGNG